MSECKLGERVPGSHQGGLCVHQINADSGLVPVLTLGPLTKVPEHTMANHHPPQVHRPPGVFQEGFQHGVELGTRPPKVSQAGLRELGRAGSQGVTVVGCVVFTRPVQFHVWLCGGGFNTGKTAPACRLHMSQALRRDNGSRPSSPRPEVM